MMLRSLGQVLEPAPTPVSLDRRGGDTDASGIDPPPERIVRDRAIVLTKEQAKGTLRAAGFSQINVLRRGMERWNESGLPVVE
jgi:hypothetical protein